MNKIKKYNIIVRDNEKNTVIYYKESDKINIIPALKYEIKLMVEKAKDLKDLDSAKIYEYCVKTKIINNYFQIKTLGYDFLEENIWNKLFSEEYRTEQFYIFKTIKLAHPFTYQLYKNSRCKIRNWGELFDLIECTNKGTRAKVKKFLEENGLMKKIKIKDSFVLILNPFLCKKSGYIGIDACVHFSEYIKPSVNIDYYGYLYLIAQGYIQFDINNVEGEENAELSII